jgi:hypothetical protein
MKKGFSIVLILVLVLSSLHFTIAEHFCQGELAAVKAGFENANASCGMEDQQNTGSQKTVSMLCCTNSSVVLSVDNYNVSSKSPQIEKKTLKLLQVLSAPVLSIIHLSPFHLFSLPDEGFHHSLMSLPGRLAFICVFRN